MKNAITDAVDLAVGLGGWKVDPSDPWKRPYTPENAALAAAERYRITDAKVIDLIAGVVKARYDDDPRDPADFR